jgi:predicted protein tyrosine phosphatase
VETDSAGLNSDADVPLSLEQIDWADIIFVMEKRHRSKLSKQFRKYLNGKRVVCLDIADEYAYMQAELVTLLEKKVGRFLGSAAVSPRQAPFPQEEGKRKNFLPPSRGRGLVADTRIRLYGIFK